MPVSKKTAFIAGAAIVAIVLALLMAAWPRVSVAAMDCSTSVVPGEELMVSIKATNKGWLEGTTDIDVLVDGVRVGCLSVKVPGSGESETEASVPLNLAPGEYRVSLAGWEGFERNVRVLTPPDIKIEEVTASPQVIHGQDAQDVEVLVKLTNEGEADGSHSLDFEVNGECVNEREASVPGLGDSEETFTLTISKPDKVSVNGVPAKIVYHDLSRPKSGTVLFNRVKGGRNEFRIVNNYDTDSLTVWADAKSKKPLVAVYVRAGSRATVRGIKDGTYLCYYSFGTSWCPACKEFLDPEYRRFEQSDVLKSTRSMYSCITVTFGTLSGGSPTLDLDPNEFPKL